MKQVRAVIKEKGFKKTYLATKLGISPQLFSMYLNEKRVMPKSIYSHLTKLLV